MAAQKRLHSLAERKPHSRAPPQLICTFAYQVIADMGFALRQTRIRFPMLLRIAGKVDGKLSNLQLRAIGMFREMRHGMPVKFPALEIHPRISPRRIGGQYSLEGDQLSPASLSKALRLGSAG